MNTQRLRVRPQSLCLRLFLAAAGRLSGNLLVVGATCLTQRREQVDGALPVVGTQQPARLGRDARRPAGKVANAGEEQGLTPQLLEHRGEERAGAFLSGGDEEQGRTDAMAPAPSTCLRVLRVASRLGLEATVGHRAHVELDQCAELAAVGVRDLDVGIGGNGARFVSQASERLAGFGLSLEPGELDTGGSPLASAT